MFDYFKKLGTKQMNRFTWFNIPVVLFHHPQFKIEVGISTRCWLKPLVYWFPPWDEQRGWSFEIKWLFFRFGVGYGGGL